MWRYFVASCVVGAASTGSTYNRCSEKVFWLREVWFLGFVLYLNCYCSFMASKCCMAGFVNSWLLQIPEDSLFALITRDWLFLWDPCGSWSGRYIPPTTKSTFNFSSQRGQLTNRFKLDVCSVIRKWWREKPNILEMLISAVVGTEAPWCHLDWFCFQDGCIGLEGNGIGSPCMFIVSLL